MGNKIINKLLLWVLGVVFSLSVSAGTNTGYLQITLHKHDLQGVCNLLYDTTGVYMHSGLGYTSNTAAWEAIVGHWGQRDGLGAMTQVDTSTFTFCMNVRDYYSNYASADSLHGGEGVGPLPAGATPYNIGLVFRESGPCPLGGDGKPNCQKGADFYCTDIFITDLPSGTPQVTDYNGDAFPPVEAVFVSGCLTGVADISSHLIKDIVVSPNPFTDHVDISFNMIPAATKVQAEVYDVMGRKVADFSPSVVSGYNLFAWDGTNMSGVKLAAGAYLLKVTNGSQILTREIIKQ